MIYAYAKAATLGFPRESEQPAKAGTAERFIQLVTERTREPQLFHAWRP